MKKFHMDHRSARKIMWVLYGLGFLLLLLGMIGSEAMFLAAAGVALILVGGVIVLLFWRCPHCGMGLPTREGNIRYCPHCGGKL